MVAGLFGVAQNAAHEGEHGDADEYARERERGAQAEQIQGCKAAENGNKGSAEVAGEAHDNRKEHKSGEGLHQAYQPRHYVKTGAFVHAVASSLA